MTHAMWVMTHLIRKAAHDTPLVTCKMGCDTPLDTCKVGYDTPDTRKLGHDTPDAQGSLWHLPTHAW